MVATAVIFASALPAMFGTFVKHRFQNTYDAILAAPVSVEELVTAEMLWIGIRAGFYGCFPLIVAMVFGLDPAWGMLLVPFFCFITALGFAGFGIAVAGTVDKIDQFSYVTTLVITPLFLVAGTFFPIDQLPEGIQVLANLNPLYQLVELVRARGLRIRGDGPAARRGAARLRAGHVAPRDPPDDEDADRLTPRSLPAYSAVRRNRLLPESSSRTFSSRPAWRAALKPCFMSVRSTSSLSARSARLNSS